MDLQTASSERNQEIIDRIRNGEMETLHELYRTGRNTIRAFVTRNSGSSDEADDILQEALVILWQRIRACRFEPLAQPGTFLFATARNLWLRQLARRKREKPLGPDDHEKQDDAVSSLDALILTEETGTLQQAMARLSEQCRSILLAFYWEELSMEQIAQRFGFANPETAKSKKYQCKRLLRELLTGKRVLR